MKVLDAVKAGIRVAHNYKKLILVLFCINLLHLTVPTVRSKLGRLMVLIFMIVDIFIEGGIKASIRDILTKEKFWGRQFLRYAKKYFGRLLGLRLIMFGVYFAPAVLVVLIHGFISDFMRKGGSSSFPIMAGVIAGFLLFLIFALFAFYASFIIVLEDEKVVSSIKRSFIFVKKHFKKVLGILGIGLGAALIGNGIILNQKIRETGMVINPVVKIISYAWNTYIGVIFTAAFMILYLALIRKSSPEEE
jgi:hypothetical protein